MSWELDFTVLFQLLGFAAMAGILWQNVRTLKNDHQKLEEILRRDITRLENELMDFKDLKLDLAVVKNDIYTIKEILQRWVKDAIHSS